jgi:hypothetical protein
LPDNIGSFGYETSFDGKGDIGVVLFGSGDPAVANQQAFEVPGSEAGALVALQDGVCDIGDILAGV